MAKSHWSNIGTLEQQLVLVVIFNMVLPISGKNVLLLDVHIASEQQQFFVSFYHLAVIIDNASEIKKKALQLNISHSIITFFTLFLPFNYYQYGSTNFGGKMVLLLDVSHHNNKNLLIFFHPCNYYQYGVNDLE